MSLPENLKWGFSGVRIFSKITRAIFCFAPISKFQIGQIFIFKIRLVLWIEKLRFRFFFHKRTYGYSRSHVFQSEEVILDFSDMRTYTLLRNFVLSDFEKG